MTHKKLRRWVTEKGVKVIYSSKLSFQEDVQLNVPINSLQGPFLRLDIPKYIKENDLFSLQNACKDYVLCIDVDVIFTNRFTQQDAQILFQSVDDGILFYGREYQKKE